jgi:hypothetical protein
MPAHAQKPDLAWWQEHLDYRLPRRAMVRPDEVGTFLGVDQKTIARMFGKKDVKLAPDLMGIEFNGGGDERQHRRILRDSAILYYALKANYTPDEFRARIFEVLTNCSARDLVLIQQAIGELIRRKQA